jgi:hypothetical protein
LQADHDSRELEIERRGDIGGRGAQVSLQALPFRVAQLSEPPELEDRQHRQQHQHPRDEKRQHGRTADPERHERSVAPVHRPESAARAGFTSLTNSFRALNDWRGRSRV